MTNIFGRNTYEFFNRFWTVVGDNFAIFLETLGEISDVAFVVEVFFNQHMRKSVNQSHVGSVFHLQMLIGNACGFYFSWVAHDDFGTFLFGFDHAAGDDRVRIRTVIAKYQQTLRVFNIADGVTHGTVTQRLLQACNRRAVAYARATIDVVIAGYRTCKFLHDIVGFVTGSARGTGMHNRFRTVLLFDFF